MSSRTLRLPPIAAEEIEVQHKDWFGAVTARASGMSITDKYIKWETARWELSYGGWSDVVTAKGYRQRREVVEAVTLPAAPTPPEPKPATPPAKKEEAK